MFYGSSNSLNVPNYDITRKSNMATKMAAVRSVTRIRFIVILESYFWCLFHGSVLLIMALSGQSVRGMGNTLVGFQSNDALFLCCCTLRQHLLGTVMVQGEYLVLC